jgi:hypothetical protein
MYHLSKKYSTVPDKEEYAIIKILLFGRIWARTVRILVENYVTIQAKAPVIWCNLPYTFSPIWPIHPMTLQVNYK